jgi:hypothetical protein
MQIYDCEMGVKYFLFNLDTKLQSSKLQVFTPYIGIMLLVQ